MVMPDGVSGADLVEKLLASQPRLKIVFTSGYTADAVNQEMLTRTGASFLSKPYAQAELTKTVRDCLDKTAATMARRLQTIDAHGNSRARRCHGRHFERHPSRRLRRARPRRRLRIRTIANPLLRAVARAYRHLIWMRHPLDQDGNSTVFWPKPGRWIISWPMGIIRVTPRFVGVSDRDRSKAPRNVSANSARNSATVSGSPSATTNWGN